MLLLLLMKFSLILAIKSRSLLLETTKSIAVYLEILKQQSLHLLHLFPRSFLRTVLDRTHTRSYQGDLIKCRYARVRYRFGSKSLQFGNKFEKKDVNLFKQIFLLIIKLKQNILLEYACVNLITKWWNTPRKLIFPNFGNLFGIVFCDRS